MAQAWFLISVFYFLTAGCLACWGGAGVMMRRLHACGTWSTYSRVLSKTALLAGGLLLLFTGCLFVWITATEGIHEALRNGGAEDFGFSLSAALLPFILIRPVLQISPTVLLLVGTMGGLAYGRAFLLVAAAC